MIRRLTAILLAMAVLASSDLSAFAQTSGLKLPQYKTVRLKNGLTVLLMEQHEIPLVSMGFLVKSGSTADPKGKEGVASMTAGLLRKGTKARTSDQISTGTLIS
ncbi:MAG: insulinase family protein [Acidobacteria bacterium]|nr:insulinase family protein [Acidobacteriota bacterium]